MKPLIGITCGLGYKDRELLDGHAPQEAHNVGDVYVTAVERAGGIPVLLPVNKDLSLVKEAVDRVDAVLMTGGSDLNPMRWGERAMSRLLTISPRRDSFDIAVAEYVLKETDKPVLGVCRGEQVMNFVMGGTTHVDLKDAGKLDHSMTFLPRTEHAHYVTVEEGSVLAGILGGGQVPVNSYHHQAVDEPGAPFVVSARSVPDGVVEAIEFPGERFVLALQWHPEGLAGDEKQQEIFRRFVEAAKRK